MTLIVVSGRECESARVGEGRRRVIRKWKEEDKEIAALLAVYSCSSAPERFGLCLA